MSAPKILITEFRPATGNMLGECLGNFGRAQFFVSRDLSNLKLKTEPGDSKTNFEN